MTKIEKISAEVILRAEKLYIEFVGAAAAMQFPGVICKNPEETDPLKRIYQLAIDKHPIKAPLGADEMDGRLYRKKGKVIVEVLNEPWSLDFPGVKCLNPKAPEPERIYQKIFLVKPIFFPDQLDEAMAKYIDYPDNFVLSMNGYSLIDNERLLRYNLKKGAYENACMAILKNGIKFLRQKFMANQLRLTYGSSKTGVDLAIETVATKFNIMPLGFSCPRFLLYVEDNKIPVFVANNADQYGDLFIKSIDALIATGGRAHALKHDVYASCIYDKRIHFIDVLNLLSKSGTGVPATVRKSDGEVIVENAAAAFGSNISFFNTRMALEQAPRNGDVWDAVFANVSSVLTEVYRDKVSAERMFG